MATSLREFLLQMGVDDPDETFARYLKSPEEVTHELRGRSLDRLLEIGGSAAKTGDIPRAQSALSRALAIDDGNERALRLLASLGKRKRRGALIAAFLTVTAIGALFAFTYSTWSNRQAASAVETREEGQPVGDAEAEQAPGVDEPGAEGGESADATPAEPTEPDPKATEPVANGRRWVVFKPTPPNVSISVDGGKPRAYGPSFQRIRLKVGTHTFRFVGAEDCCEERVIRRRIPRGSRDYEFAVKLKYRPARLYLKGPAPPEASVRITLPGNRRINGRIREILRIPMSSLRASAQVEIRAPGYRTHKSVVKLRAGGDLTEHSFTLEREGETP